MKAQLTEQEYRKYSKGICIVPYCSRCRRKGRNICAYHAVKKWRESHPLEYTFQTLRNNAKRRGKDFSLTLKEFFTFVKRENYLELKGRTKLCLSIDRDKNEFGYHAWNIKGITVSENSIKRNYVDYPKGKKFTYVKPEGEPF